MGKLEKIQKQIIKANQDAHAKLVSISITSFNRPEYLQELLRSCLTQTYQNIEVLVWDDASDNPKVKQVLTGWQKKDKRLTRIVYEKRHTGVPNRGRNLNCLLARGEYILFIDDDDRLYPTAIDQYLSGFQKDTLAGGMYCVFDTIDDQGKPRGQLYQFGKRPDRVLTIRDIQQANHIGLPEMMLNRAIFRITGLFDERLPALMDWDLWIRLFQNFRVGQTWQTLGSVRLHNKGRITSNGKRYGGHPQVKNVFEYVRQKYVKQSTINIGVVLPPRPVEVFEAYAGQIEMLVHRLKEYPRVKVEYYEGFTFKPQTKSIILCPGEKLAELIPHLEGLYWKSTQIWSDKPAGIQYVYTLPENLELGWMLRQGYSSIPYETAVQLIGREEDNSGNPS